MFGPSEAGQELHLRNRLSTVPHKVILKASSLTAYSLGLKRSGAQVRTAVSKTDQVSALEAVGPRRMEPINEAH